MSRARTGTVWYDEARGCWAYRLTLSDGSRSPAVYIDTLTARSPNAKKRAVEVAAERSQVAAEKKLTAADFGIKPRAKASAPEGETVSQYFERWLTARERRGLRSTRDDRGRYEKWVAPALGGRPVAGVTRPELKELVRSLDEAVQRRELSWKTATNVWGLVTKLFSDACAAKEKELCVRDDNPCSGVRAPDRGGERAGAYLFPSEATRLLGCPGVPLHLRQIYALAIYLYVRGGELAALEWSDVNLERGYVLVHRSLNTGTGATKATKTKRTRKVPIEPALVPLLREMHDEADGEGRVVEMPAVCEWAAGLRRHLRIAGVTRADLFAHDETRRQISFHDLRHTGITWRAVRGDPAFDIKDGAGHTDLETTQRYVNEARVFGDDFGEPFPALPAALSRDESSWESSGVPQVPEMIASLRG
jgi:integrase